VIIRCLVESDIPKINEIWERCHKGKYGIPNRNFLVTEAVTELSDKITGYGMVRFFAEAMLYLDKDLSPYEQAKSFKLLIERAILDCAGLDQLNVAVKDKEFEELLKNRYGFVDRGKVIFKELT